MNRFIPGDFDTHIAPPSKTERNQRKGDDRAAYLRGYDGAAERKGSYSLAEIQDFLKRNQPSTPREQGWRDALEGKARPT